MNLAENILGKHFKETMYLKAFGLLKIPSLAFVGPSVHEISDNKCVIKIPLNWRTKNHLGSMYFGVLAAGADCAGGFCAMRAIEKSGKKVSLVFKDFKAEFLRRAESDVYFVCEQIKESDEFVQKVIANAGQRMEMPIYINAYCKDSQEPVAKFILGLSLKAK